MTLQPLSCLSDSPFFRNLCMILNLFSVNAPKSLQTNYSASLMIIFHDVIFYLSSCLYMHFMIIYLTLYIIYTLRVPLFYFMLSALLLTTERADGEWAKTCIGTGPKWLFSRENNTFRDLKSDYFIYANLTFHLRKYRISYLTHLKLWVALSSS